MKLIPLSLLAISLWLLPKSNHTISDDFKDCGTKDDKERAEIKSFSIQPKHIQAGQNVNISVDVNLKETVESGQIKITVSLKTVNVQLFSKVVDLCDTVKKINKECPIKPGEIKLSYSKKLPSFIPSGNFTGTIHITDQDQQELICLEFNLDL